MGFERRHRGGISQREELVEALARIHHLGLERSRELLRRAEQADEARPTPGRRTLLMSEERTEDVPRPTLAGAPRAGEPGELSLMGAAPGPAFDELRSCGLHDVLVALDAVSGRRGLAQATLAAARRAVRPPMASQTGRPAPPDPSGQAMWRAAERRAATLYRRAVDGEGRSEDPVVDQALQRIGGGRALPDGVRRAMERELGVPLDRVRIHTDSVAAEAARAVCAEAFTVGEDIFFAEHTFAPDTETGAKLLAHELTHVVQAWQQRTRAGRPGARVSDPNDDLEHEANAAAERFGRNGRRSDSDPRTAGAASAEAAEAVAEVEADVAADARIAGRPAHVGAGGSVIQRREVPNSTTISNDRDWTASDRTGRTQRWKDACYANLMALRNTEYTRVIERADFYWWFYNHTTALGCTTRWALAAAIVATGVNEMVDLSPFMESNGSLFGTMSNELQAFGREGNQVIFDNVFPKLRRLLVNAERNGPMTGPAALQWDMQILSEEQTLIQPLYNGLSPEARRQIENIVRLRGVPGAAASVIGPTVQPGDHNRGGDIPPFTGSDLHSSDQRWAYGMQLGRTFGPASDPAATPFDPAAHTRPPPGQGYQDGSELAAVRTRPNLHQLDAIIDRGQSVSTADRARAVTLMGSLTASEQMEVLRDRSPDHGEPYSTRLRLLTNRELITALRPWRADLELQMQFLDNNFGNIRGRWVEFEYSDLAPMIRPFSQSQKDRLHTNRWRTIFVWVCTDSTITDAVNDLGMRNPTRQEWIDEERSVF